MKTKIYGHRGSKGKYPENSLLSFKKALNAGVEGIELDVHLTKDNEIVVFHDGTLERTSTGSGYVKDYTLAELKKFSVGAKFKDFENYEKSWDNEFIPTLKEVIDLLNQYNVELNIELKTYEIDYPGIEERLLQEMKKYKFKGKVVYSSFNLPTVMRLNQVDPTCEISLLSEFTLYKPIDYLKTLNLEAIHMDKDVVLADPEFWRPVADKLRIWTVNSEEEINALLDLGVAAIITDYPERALALRK